MDESKEFQRHSLMLDLSDLKAEFDNAIMQGKSFDEVKPLYLRIKQIQNDLAGMAHETNPYIVSCADFLSRLQLSIRKSERFNLEAKRFLDNAIVEIERLTGSKLAIR